MRKLDISVIIPAFNAEETIARALTSVINQTYRPIELIVVNDCSSDRTEEFIIRFFNENTCDFKVKTINLEVNSGPGRARNIGVEVASGNILAFLDSDDWWLPWHLASIAVLTSKHGVNELVINQQPMLENNESFEQQSTAVESQSLGLLNFFLIQANYCTPGLAVCSDLFRSVGGFPESRRFAEDFELFINLRMNCRSWIRVTYPRSVMCGKHFYTSGRGLSSRHFAMYFGTLQALFNSLIKTPFFWLIPPLLFFHSVKYIRRLLIISVNGK